MKITRSTLTIGLLGLALSMATMALAAQDKKGATLTEAEVWQQLSQFKFGGDERVLIAAADLVMKAGADPAKKKEVEARMAGLLETATPDAKRFLCRQLWIVGTAQSVPALAKLLVDEQLSDAARYGLERMQYPAAGAALREAAGKVKGKALVGVIDSIGGRRDAEAVSAIAPRLADADPAVAAAAAWALGRIATPEAAAALGNARAKADPKAKRVLDDAYLMAADGLAAAGKKEAAVAIYQPLCATAEPRRVRVAAMRGLAAVQPQAVVPRVVEALKSDDVRLRAMAAAVVREVSGSEAVRALADELPRLAPDTQVTVLGALAIRADAAARPAVVEAAASKEAAVKIAALKTLGAVGNQQDVAMLLAAAAAPSAGPEREAARASLVRLRGAEAALLAATEKGETAARVEAIAALAARRCTAALPAMVKLTAEKEGGIRSAAIDAVGQIGSEADVHRLVALALADPKQSQSVPSAVGNIARRTSDRNKVAAPIIGALAKADQTCKPVLVQMLSAAGGDKAVEALRSLLKDPDAEIAESVLRSLANWEDDRPAADLLEVARSSTVAARQVIALRGYIRMIGLAKERPATETLARYAEAMKLARRADETKAALAGLGEVKDAAAMKLIEPCLADEATKAEAAAAALRVARAIQGGQQAQAVEIAKKVLATTKDPNLVRQAREIAGIKDVWKRK